MDTMSIRIKHLIKRLLWHCGLSIAKVREPDRSTYFSLENLLHQFLARKGALFLIQIGANDGKRNDPLNRFIMQNGATVKGILLEPMKDVFQVLTETYGEFPGIVTVNAAIHNTKKEMILYKVAKDKLDQLPLWAGGMASFNPDHHTLTATPSEHIVTESVVCMTLAELYDRYKVDHVDLLCMDTEGYDAEIIANLDFKRMTPSIIHFEHGLMDGIMTPEKFMTVVRFLNDHGYQVIMESYDATAYRPEMLLPLAPESPISGS
jgi:FkbM family methyltransferase